MNIQFSVLNKKIIFLLFLAGVSCFSTARAQDSLLYRKQPIPFVSYFNIGVGTTGAEAGFSVRLRNQVSTGLFLHAFYNEPGSLHSINSQFLVGFETKFYLSPSSTSFYAGPLAGVDDFGTGLRPLLGITTGFDHYGSFTFFKKYTLTRVGLALKGGLDTAGHGYIGIGFSVGFGYLNNGEIKSDHPPPFLTK